MKEKRSDTFFYIFLAVAGFLILGAGVFAIPNPGHSFDQVSPPLPCGDNQYLKWTGSAWACATPSCPTCPTCPTPGCSWAGWESFGSGCVYTELKTTCSDGSAPRKDTQSYCISGTITQVRDVWLCPKPTTGTCQPTPV